MKAGERPGAPADFSTSLGFSVGADGELGSVWWGSPAFKAGMAPGARIAAIDGKAFSIDGLRAAILAAEKATAPMTFLVERGKRFQTVEIDYHGGLRYPTLERVPGTPDRLDAILAAK
jgi:predicted metalloprotease with PDZ domain